MCWEEGAWGQGTSASWGGSPYILLLYSSHTWGSGAPHWVSGQLPGEQDLLGCKERGQCVRIWGALSPPESPCFACMSWEPQGNLMLLPNMP